MNINRPTVSVIIPVYNQIDYLYNCLNSIRSKQNSIEYEIIIIDDSSSRESAEAIDKLEGIRLIRNYKNLGFLRSCNRAALNAKGKFILFLNSDTEVCDHWLDELVSTMESYPNAALVGSKLVYPDGTLQECGGIVWNDGSAWNFGRNDHPDKPEYNYTKEVDYVSGAAILVNKALFLEVGLFDIRYTPAYYEDTDLAFKLRAIGKRVLIEPKSVVIHHEGKSCGTDENSGIKLYQNINKSKFYNKWYDIIKTNHFPNGQKVLQARDRSANKRKILVIDHYVPTFDRDAGSRCMYMYLQMLVDMGMCVTFFPDNFHHDPHYTYFIEKMGIEVLYGAHYLYNHEQWLSDNLSTYDYIFLSRPHITIKHLDAVKKHCTGKIIYFGHDIHHLRLMREAKLLGKDLQDEIDSSKSQELTIWENSDYILYPSDEEVEYVHEHFPNKNAIEVPIYFYDENETPEKRYFEGSSGILFVGNFQHPPNLDAINWFLDKVLPSVFESVKDHKFTICGSSIPIEIERLASDRISILKNVSDEELKELYSSSRLSIVPLRFGAGVKGKVLESLFYQIPLVTTRIGTQGIPCIQDCASIADEPEPFGQACIELLSEETKWAKASTLSRPTLFKKYSLSHAKAIFSKIDQEYLTPNKANSV